MGQQAVDHREVVEVAQPGERDAAGGARVRLQRADDDSGHGCGRGDRGLDVERRRRRAPQRAPPPGQDLRARAVLGGQQRDDAAQDVVVEGAQQIDVDVDCLAAAAAVMSSHGMGSGRRLLLATGLGLAAPPPLERPRRHHIHGCAGKMGFFWMENAQTRRECIGLDRIPPSWFPIYMRDGWGGSIGILEVEILHQPLPFS